MTMKILASTAAFLLLIPGVVAATSDVPSTSPSPVIYMGGSVRQPGVYTFADSDNLTLLKAIKIAGSPKPGDYEVMLTRKEPLKYPAPFSVQ